MATSSDLSTLEEATSPLPRAPPPSPECLHQTTDLNQFDFSALLSRSKPPRSLGQSPNSSYNSSVASPTWNESGSYSHSPFFYPSPDHFHDSPSHSDSNAQSICSYPDSLKETPSIGGLSISMPVNGELQYMHYLNGGQSITNPHMMDHDSMERKRKISLKRQHEEEMDHSWYSTSYDQSWLWRHEKKVRSSDERDRECRDYNHQSLSPQRTRASTFSGINTHKSSRMTHHLSTDFNQLTLGANKIPSHNAATSSNSQGTYPYQLLTLGGQVGLTTPSPTNSHVTPHSTQTIGFITGDENMSSNDDQMDTDRNTSGMKISIIKPDDNDTSMDCSKYTPFSFNLDTHLHPNISMTLGTTYGHYLDGNATEPLYHNTNAIMDVTTFSRSL
jgi:hypothetical protein